MNDHPMQPLEIVNGIIRFKKNEIVAFLLDNGGYTMNDLAIMYFSNEDSSQFAQLIGYSVCGWADLSYAPRDRIEIAEQAAEEVARGLAGTKGEESSG